MSSFPVPGMSLVVTEDSNDNSEVLNSSVPERITAVPCSNPGPPQPTLDSVSYRVGCHL